MTDRRLTPANARVAAIELQDVVDAPKFVEGDMFSIVASVSDLRATPDGKRDRQLQFGEAFRVLETREGWSFGQAVQSGYVGYIRQDDLGPANTPTHFVSARATHLYPEANFKAEEICSLGFGARVEIIARDDRFATLKSGEYVPHKMLTPMSDLIDDPVVIAEMFLGVSYLWGGNSIHGIDCSGLVQMGLQLSGHACPGDADMQERTVGTLIGDNVQPQRGDLYFWAGHVGILKDENTLIHANVHHMAVAEEPLNQAIERIAVQGFGGVTSRRRL